MNFINAFGKIPLLLFIMILGGSMTCGATYVDPKNYGSPKGEVCIKCHQETSPGIYNQWLESAHGQAGVNCYDCHRAEKGDSDAFEHKELISIVVTPKDCSKCHEKEFKEFSSSHHADAVAVLDSTDNFFGRSTWGIKNQRTACIPCHGSTLEVQKKGKLAPATWPNTGIGRINPDGSKGSCTACHTRHLFSVAQARRPEACGRCHSGQSQPQIEVYTRSKHGVMFAAYDNRMNMDHQKWRAGKDYYQAPTCATCHMGSIPPQMEVKTADERIRTALESVLSKDQQLLTALLPPTPATKINYGATHDVSSRLSWKLSPVICKKRDNWQENRQQMESVCQQCHGEHFVKQHYEQFDALVGTYKKIFADPATRMRRALIKHGDITKENFDDQLDLTYWKLWNNGGRGALNGAAMAGPVYLWNNGMQEVSQRYYMEFIPEVKKLYGRGADSFLRKNGYIRPTYKK
ncbi:MAG: cytochrome C552 [Deltaproteobacteria bacterium]|nr:cytochrome C552 [Deltaproteobacteria bacterium]